MGLYNYNVLISTNRIFYAAKKITPPKNHKLQLKLLLKRDVLPSSGSLPSTAAGLVSFAACLAFFFDFFPYKENNNGLNR